MKLPLSYLPLIIRNALRSRRRSVLTVLSIAVSFCMLGVLMAMYCLFFINAAPPDQALRLIVRNRISVANPIPVSYIGRIKEISGVREVMIQQWFGGAYRNSHEAKNNFARFAVEPEKLFLMHPDYEIPESQRQTFLSKQNSCIIGSALARRLTLRVGDTMMLNGDIFPVKATLVVAGVYQSSIDSEVLYFSNRLLNESLPRKLDSAMMLMVLVDNPESVAVIARRIDAVFRNSPAQTKTETEKGFRFAFLEYTGNIKLFLIVVCACLTATILLVCANTMAIAIRERAAEAGVLKAIGFTSQTVLWLILTESMLVALAGGVIGFCCAYAMILEIRRVPMVMVSLSGLEISPIVAGGGLALAALAGLLASLPSAWEVSRRGIIESLRFAD